MSREADDWGVFLPIVLAVAALAIVLVWVFASRGTPTDTGGVASRDSSPRTERQVPTAPPNKAPATAPTPPPPTAPDRQQ